MVLDRGLEPAIVRVRGGPPNHLEESSIIKTQGSPSPNDRRDREVEITTMNSAGHCSHYLCFN